MRDRGCFMWWILWSLGPFSAVLCERVACRSCERGWYKAVGSSPTSRSDGQCYFGVRERQLVNGGRYSLVWRLRTRLCHLTAFCGTQETSPDGRRQHYPLTLAECCAGWMGLWSSNKLSLSIRSWSQLTPLQSVRTKTRLWLSAISTFLNMFFMDSFQSWW